VQRRQPSATSPSGSSPSGARGGGNLARRPWAYRPPDVRFVAEVPLEERQVGPRTCWHHPGRDRGERRNDALGLQVVRRVPAGEREEFRNADLDEAPRHDFRRRARRASQAAKSRAKTDPSRPRPAGVESELAFQPDGSRSRGNLPLTEDDPRPGILRPGVRRTTSSPVSFAAGSGPVTAEEQEVGDFLGRSQGHGGSWRGRYGSRGTSRRCRPVHVPAFAGSASALSSVFSHFGSR